MRVAQRAAPEMARQRCNQRHDPAPHQRVRRGLAYVDERPVWWCPELRTVLANEEVVDGRSEVGGYPVERRNLRQWVLRITAYAERLLADARSDGGSVRTRTSQLAR